jgi:hypothetical protein
MDIQLPFVDWMVKNQPISMQKLAGKTELTNMPISIGGAVDTVPRHRKADSLSMHPNLVQPPGPDLDIHQCVFEKPGNRIKNTMSLPSLGTYFGPFNLTGTSEGLQAVFQFAPSSAPPPHE